MTSVRLGLVMLAICTSCSFARVRGFEEPTDNTRPSCTQSYTWPIVDGVVAAVLTGVTIYAVATHDSSMAQSDAFGPADAWVAGLGSLGALTHAISGIYGRVKVGTCREEMSRY